MDISQAEIEHGLLCLCITFQSGLFDAAPVSWEDAKAEARLMLGEMPFAVCLARLDTASTARMAAMAERGGAGFKPVYH